MKIRLNGMAFIKVPLLRVNRRSMYDLLFFHPRFFLSHIGDIRIGKVKRGDGPNGVDNLPSVADRIEFRSNDDRDIKTADMKLFSVGEPNRIGDERGEDCEDETGDNRVGDVLGLTEYGILEPEPRCELGEFPLVINLRSGGD